MKFRLVAVVLGGLSLGLLLGLYLLRPAPSAAEKVAPILPPAVSAPAAAFELTGLNGHAYQLSSFKGTPVIINFWATWCPPCKEEMPLLQRYSQKYAGQLQVLGVDYEEDAQVVEPFIKGMGITFPILLDPAGKIADRYFVKDFPYSFFVDKEGIVRGQHLGQLSEDLLVQYLKTIGIEP